MPTGSLFGPHIVLSTAEPYSPKSVGDVLGGLGDYLFGRLGKLSMEHFMDRDCEQKSSLKLSLKADDVAVVLTDSVAGSTADFLGPFH